VTGIIGFDAPPNLASLSNSCKPGDGNRLKRPPARPDTVSGWAALQRGRAPAS
jgi:hypothetical protein